MKWNENLAALRKEQGLSQQAVAEALGVSRQAVSRWEVGQVLPATEHLLALAALYQVSVDRLLNGRGEENGKKKGRGKWLPALLAALLCLVTAIGRANHAPMEGAVLCLLLAAGAALTCLALWLRKFLQKNWTMP